MRSNKSKRWSLTAASLVIPFMIVWIFSAIYYSNTSWRYSSLAMLGFPVAWISALIPIKLAPVTALNKKILLGIGFFLVAPSVLFFWSLICAFWHGDSF